MNIEPKNSQFGPQKVKNNHKIKLKSNVSIEGNKQNKMNQTNAVMSTSTLVLVMIPSIVTREFDLIIWLFLTFWGPNGLSSGS